MEFIGPLRVPDGTKFGLIVMMWSMGFYYLGRLVQWWKHMEEYRDGD